MISSYLGRQKKISSSRMKSHKGSSLTSSTISTTEIEQVIEQLKKDKYRRSTQRNYYCVWRVFNQFFIQLDRKPNNWEDRILLFAAYLIKENRKSTTVRSYVSAIKAVLADINVLVDENRCLLNSLTRACKLTRDSFTVRLPIQKDMLNVLLSTTYKYHLHEGQPYIAHLYVALFPLHTMDFLGLEN